MKISSYRIGFIGFGHMAQIICKGIEGARLIPRSQMGFVRRDPSKIKKSEQEFGITSTSLQNLVETSDLLFLCVRPSQAETVLKDLKQIGVESKMLITVLAGVPLSYYQKYLGSEVQLLRVMPNIASAVGEGMSVFSFGTTASSEFRSAASLLFSSLGETLEVPENLMDISCGIAGSGPGFVLRLIEAMARTGEKHGLAYEKALKMAAQSFAGAARLILKGASPETLIQQIATPNGTTEAGFKSMNASQVDVHFQDAASAAAKRSKEISEENPS
jgi:pyrroline-5-carboxylate reductase